MSAGALNSPKLLQLSGIGPAELLTKLGIEVRHALPGVGDNLSDHYTSRIVARAKDIRTINNLVRGPRLVGEAAKWLMRLPSVLGLNAALVYAFGRSEPQIDRPDYTVIFTPASYRAGFLGALDEFPGMTCGAWQIVPRAPDRAGSLCGPSRTSGHSTQLSCQGKGSSRPLDGVSHGEGHPRNA